MDEAQKEYLSRLNAINTLNCSKSNKCRLIQGLIAILKDHHTFAKSQQVCKNRQNTDNLSTSISCTESMIFERDIDEMQESILQKQNIKIETNEQIQTLQEQLFELQKIVQTKREYNDYLKKKIDQKMKKIANQKQSEQLQSSRGHDRQRSYLNKSLESVTDLFKIAKWW